MQTALDHVALVVRSLEPVLERLAPAGLAAMPIEEFPSEGTREVYLGAGSARLLVMEPTSPDGPYGRALAKRGPGLHHVALNAPNLDAFLSDVRGWLLHPMSPRTIAATRTLWLARPGVPTLVEVNEGEPPSGEPVVSAVEVAANLDDLVPLAGLSKATEAGVWLTIGGVRFSAADLLI